MFRRCAVMLGILCLVFSGAGAVAASSVRFCAVDWTGKFTYIDSQLGQVGPTRSDLGYYLQELAWSPNGTLYAAQGRTTGDLLTIDPITGDLTYLLSIAPDIRGMAFSSDGTLYATVQKTTYTQKLITIDLATGNTATIGDLWGSEYAAQGLAFSPSGVLYGILPYNHAPGYALYTIDLDDAQEHLVGASSSPWNFNQAITFTSDGSLYALGGNQFVQLNPSTGAIIGAVFTLDGDYRGLAVVPEPSTIILLGIGAISLFACTFRRRRKLHNLRLMILAAIVFLAAGSAQADVFNMGGTRDPVTGTWTGQASLEFVTVGDAGNATDIRQMEWGESTYGSVGYAYIIGQFEVTNAQWREFLSSKARYGDSYGLYNVNMAGTKGGISRTGDGTLSSPFVYSAKNNDIAWDNRPVNFISFWDAARFCNWLHNGQGDADTESGAYENIGNQVSFSRQADAQYFIPTENEWYKAAYYKGGGLDAGYWLYPTKSNEQPSYALLATGTNNANYSGTNSETGVTMAGAFAASSGPYRTFDQAGNVWEFIEASAYPNTIEIRGGCWSGIGRLLSASSRSVTGPTWEADIGGFRVASVPEPSALVLLGFGAIGLIGYAWRRRTTS